MKRLTAAASLCAILALIAVGTAGAQGTVPSPKPGSPVISPAGVAPDKSGFGEVVRIGGRIRDIEKKATDEDPELKKLWEDVSALHEQYQKKLKAKLASNTEYQDLTKRLEELRKQWRERREAEKKNDPGAPRPKTDRP